jgi:hypothetical protein
LFHPVPPKNYGGKLMKNYPTFEVDDSVKWRSNVGRITPEAMAYRRKRYGDGPFRVQSTRESAEAHKRPDKQWVVVEKDGQALCHENGKPATWSCAWFQKA